MAAMVIGIGVAANRPLMDLPETQETNVKRLGELGTLYEKVCTFNTVQVNFSDFFFFLFN